MPVRKFRSVEEMKTIWRQPGDPRLYRAIEQVWRFGRRTVPRHFPPGVHRYRSIEELDAAVERWAQADTRRLADSRRDRSQG